MFDSLLSMMMVVGVVGFVLMCLVLNGFMEGRRERERREGRKLLRACMRRGEEVRRVFIRSEHGK